MPRLFRVYTRVHMYFSAYAIKIIKKYIKIPYFRAGLMVTQVVQPPQHVANCFQLLKLLWGSIKAPHVYGLREREIIDIILCWNPLSKSEFPCLLHFPVHYKKPLFPGDAHLSICHLVCTSSEGILARQGWDGSRRRSARRSWKDSGDLSTRYFCTCYL